MPRHATSGSFKPGRSGNPGGVPRAIRQMTVAETEQMRQEAAIASQAGTIAARKATPEMIDILIRIARTGKTEAIRISAANSVLDRGQGKPVVPTVNFSDVRQQFDKWTLEETRAFREKWAASAAGNYAPLLIDATRNMNVTRNDKPLETVEIIDE